MAINKFKGTLKAIGDRVLVSDMHFGEQKTKSGLIIGDDNGQTRGIYPRWGQVYAVGPLQKDVQAGQYILISHGRWTRGIKIDDGTGERVIRKIDPNDILMVSDEPMTDETMSDKVF